MPQDIGKHYKSRIPQLADDANIEEALKLYHYGISNWNNEEPSANSIEGHIISVNNDIDSINTTISNLSTNFLDAISSSLDPNIITPETSSTVPLTIKGVSSQSAILQRWQTYNSTNLASLYPDGGFASAAYMLIGTTVPGTTPTGTALSVNTINASDKGVSVIGKSTQTANLQEWLKGASIVASISSDGNIASGNISATGNIVASGSGTVNSLTVTTGTSALKAVTTNNISATGTISASGDISTSAGNISASGSITSGTYLSATSTLSVGTTSTLTGTVTLGSSANLVFSNPASVISGLNTLSMSDTGSTTWNTKNAAGTLKFYYGATNDENNYKAGINTSGQIVSAIADGVSPFSIISTTMVNNLTSQYLGSSGQDAAHFKNAANLTGTISSARLNSTYTNIVSPTTTGASSGGIRKTFVADSATTPTGGDNGDIWLTYI